MRYSDKLGERLGHFNIIKYTSDEDGNVNEMCWLSDCCFIASYTCMSCCHFKGWSRKEKYIKCKRMTQSMMVNVKDYNKSITLQKQKETIKISKKNKKNIRKRVTKGIE